MTAALRVVVPGLATTIQDTGRSGYQRQGVPVSGALDRVALAAANIVVGNAADAAGVEMLYQGAAFNVVADTVRVAVAGAGAKLAIEDGDGAPKTIDACESVTVRRGALIKVTIPGPGIAAYLAVAGSFDVPPVMGSRSTYARAAIGGIDGRRLTAGDSVSLAAPTAPAGDERRLAIPNLGPPSVARVVAGPQDDHFSRAAWDAFLGATWRVLPMSDRMGLRLDGPTIAAEKGHDIVSDGIAPGAIQVPGDGRPIVLLADRQTTGGYAKIATVISADIPALGRLAPGMAIRFAAVDISEAEAARRKLDAEIARWPTLLVDVASGALDTARLLSANLIDGVVDAHEPSVHA
jgi:biotin-dependent carboxylase-like uncharacterized protein